MSSVGRHSLHPLGAYHVKRSFLCFTGFSMPPFSFKFHRPRFLRSLGSPSRSPNPLPTDPRNGPPPLALDPSHAPSSRAPSTPRVPEQRANTTATGTSHSAASGNIVHHQTSTGDVLADCDGHLSAASHVGTSRDIAPLN